VLELDVNLTVLEDEDDEDDEEEDNDDEEDWEDWEDEDEEASSIIKLKGVVPLLVPES
jgi:hypothetical protein